jgi:hypothetical protein
MTFPNQISDPPASNAPRVVNEELGTLAAFACYGKKARTTTGLTWGYYGGIYGGFAVEDGTLTLTASSTNYVVVAVSTGVISVSTSATNWNDADNYVRVYKIPTGASGPTTASIEDHRFGPGGVAGGGAAGGDVDLAADVTGELPVANGGTGRASHTAYAVVCGGTTSTAAQQSIASVGTSGHVLTSNGAGALPTFQAPTLGGDASTNTASSVDSEVAVFSGAGGKTLKRATGSGLAKLTSGVLSTATAGTDYYAPSGTDVAVADGGTGASSLTAYAVLCGGTTSTGAVQPVASVGTAGHVLTSNGAGALPTFQAATGGGTIGKHAIYVAAGSMRPSTTGGCAALAGIASASNQPDIVTLDFDATTQEYAQFGVVMPKSWDEGTVTFKAHWSHPSTTTNFGVVWDLQGVAISDDDAIAASYGTAQTSTDTGGTTNDLYASPESSAITIAGSPAAEDMAFFRLSRVTGNGSDTMAVDARLHGITLYITTSAETDA